MGWGGGISKLYCTGITGTRQNAVFPSTCSNFAQNVARLSMVLTSLRSTVSFNKTTVTKSANDESPNMFVLQFLVTKLGNEIKVRN